MTTLAADSGVSGRSGPATRKPLLLRLAVLIAAGVGLAWWFLYRAAAPTELVLHGAVDLRQVDLPFNGDQRIATVLVEEGDRVRAGQPLARLDTGRLQAAVDEGQAQVAMQNAAVERLHRGSRPEEIAELRAGLQGAEADAANAQDQYQRQRRLMTMSGGRAGSQQDVDNAKAALDVAAAKATQAREALDLAVLGPRQEDIAEGEAQLKASQAHLALLQRQLADAELLAPADGVVRARLMEPGEMASPGRAVLSLAITSPKWVRAYVPEPDLGKIRPGEAAEVTIDSFPGHRFPGWIGFISPVAEFTPKTVQTDDLRTSLVYEVRVFVKDPAGALPLGAPATVHLPSTLPAEQAR